MSEIEPCVVPGCSKRRRSSRMDVCEMHYCRMRRTGTYDPRPRVERPPTNPVPPENCYLDGCDDPAARRANGIRVCRRHGQRWDRYGRFHRVKDSAKPRPARQPCIITDCESIDDGPHGMCKMHRTRYNRHGDPLVAIAQADRDLATGPDHWAWTGDDATYEAVHQRVKSLHGSASNRDCVDCSGPAAHWSYDHSDPDERHAPKGPYSLDVGRYAPRCVSCHKRFDMAYLRSAS